ncbi:Uncharacterised protein [Candidatus Tiddalikarchaeum anstoanum]|nr:Uncharacterised protein [Candidatus Tiddalikarchaeum anstoanum]
MAQIWDAALNLASSDPLTFGLIFAIGFLVCHLFHAVRYSFLQFGTGLVDKFKKFLKYLFFLKVQ